MGKQWRQQRFAHWTRYGGSEIEIVIEWRWTVQQNLLTHWDSKTVTQAHETGENQGTEWQKRRHSPTWNKLFHISSTNVANHGISTVFISFLFKTLTQQITECSELFGLGICHKCCKSFSPILKYTAFNYITPVPIHNHWHQLEKKGKELYLSV